MDKEKARSILEGEETTNSLKRQGSLIRNPSVVVTLVVDGSESVMSYGSTGLTESDLDYLVHRDKGVTLKDKIDYYENKDVVAKVFSLDGNSVNLKKYRATSDESWQEL